MRRRMRRTMHHCGYGVQVKTGWGGDAALARPSLLPFKRSLKLDQNSFLISFASLPLPSPNQFIFSKQQIQNRTVKTTTKRCQGYDRCIEDDACNWQHLLISAAIWSGAGSMNSFQCSFLSAFLSAFLHNCFGAVLLL